MKRLALIVALISAAAYAGELWVGTLTPRGLSTNNKGAGSDAGFRLGTSQKISVQCTNPDAGAAATTVCINVATCTSQLGILITGNQVLPTSTANNQVALGDGGYTALVSAYSVDNNNCIVCLRNGNEF